MTNEKRLIDANALVKIAEKRCGVVNIKHIDEQPTVDAVEVVRKPVRGYEGQYVVDQFGRVYGVDRTTTVLDNGRIYEKPIAGKQMKPTYLTNKNTDDLHSLEKQATKRVPSPKRTSNLPVESCSSIKKLSHSSKA